MIPVNETADFDDFGKKEVIDFDLDVEAQAQVYALDFELDAAGSLRRPGEMFESILAKSEYSPAVVNAVKNLWEAGGWVVGVFENVYRMDGADVDIWRLVFARPSHRDVLSVKVTKALEVRRQAEDIDLSGDSVEVATLAPRLSGGLLVRMPTRARPSQALKVLSAWREMASEHVQIEVVIDDDDVEMNNARVLSYLSDLDCVVTIGKHRNKIEACNGGRVDDWSVLVLASDDMVPVVNGYDLTILAAFEKHFPLFCGSLCYNDGYNFDHVREGEPVTCTLPVLGRHLYEDYGRRVYHPGYKSIYCDSEQSMLLTKMNRMVFIDEAIVEHRHPAAGRARYDELYKENSRYDEGDRKLFEERRARGFDAPSVVLSILICTTRSRRRQLERLVDYLRWQARSYYDENGGKTVEICVDSDERATVGEKRQRLLERAVGEHVCFVDDDDWVAHDYVCRLVQACWKKTDCASLVGIYTVNGENPRRFEHSLKYERWEEQADGLLVRTPNHLNLVRREIALKVGFVSKNVGEDHAFSNAIKPLLETEADTGDEPLYYYFSRPRESVQSRGA